MPFRYENRCASNRSRGDAGDALVVVGIELLRDIDETFAAARVDSPRSPVIGKAVDHSHGRDGCDDGAGIRIEHDHARRRAHAQEETVVLLVEVQSDIFLDPGNRPFGQLGGLLGVEYEDLSLLRYEHIEMPATLIDDTTAGMRV